MNLDEDEVASPGVGESDSSEAQSSNSQLQNGSTSSAPSKRGKTPTRNFPVYTLESALAVGRAIKENNAGNPWPPTQVSKALRFGEKSSKTDLIFRASALYGLTSGTRAASNISLEKNGRDILYAPSPERELLAKRSAFLRVRLDNQG